MVCRLQLFLYLQFPSWFAHCSYFCLWQFPSWFAVWSCFCIYSFRHGLPSLFLHLQFPSWFALCSCFCIYSFRRGLPSAVVSVFTVSVVVCPLQLFLNDVRSCSYEYNISKIAPWRISGAVFWTLGATLHSNMATTFLLLDAIKNQKPVKLIQLSTIDTLFIVCLRLQVPKIIMQVKPSIVYIPW